MNKNRHLTLEERIIIESWLQKKESFKSIGRELGRDSTTIAKEVKNHIQFKQILYPWPGYEREYFS
jgi:IS30 family transposase